MISPDLKKAKEGDKQALERFTRQNTGLIACVAKRFFGRAEPGELFQTASLGFVKAVRNFDEANGAAFSSYAFACMTGEIKRYLRDDGLVKASRSARENNQKLRAAEEKISRLEGRSPRLGELAKICGLTPEEAAAAADMPGVLSLEQQNERGVAIKDSLASEYSEDSVIESICLRECLGALPPMQKAVISLRYSRGLTQQDAARIMGVSQTHISRLERAALDQLRKLL